MKRAFPRLFAFFLVLLQLSSVFVVDAHHTEYVFGTPHAKQALKSHDCGAREIHKSIGHYCLACVRHANFNPVVTAPFVPTFGSSVIPTRVSSYIFIRLSDFYVSASKRGPPSLFS